MNRIAIFASGAGSNAAKILEYFQDSAGVEIALIVSNHAKAGVLDLAEKNEIPSLLLDREFFYQSNQILFELKHREIDLVVLAGFLWLVPVYFVKAYKNRMINIHPALLPKFGGKGMYGMNVHAAVKEAGESKSGITIHYVNREFDEGAIIFQASTEILPSNTPEEIRASVLKLEHRYFPRVIDRLIQDDYKPKLPLQL